MGSVLQSMCSCGFESKELSVGGGMMDFEEKCYVPYFCDHCEIVRRINIKTKNPNNISETGIRKDIKCSKCRRKVQYYGEIREYTFDTQNDYVFDWKIDFEQSYFLQDKLYYCPKCKKLNLKFYSVACWD